MSSGSLRHWVLRITSDASRAAALALPRRTSASSGLTLASGASLMSRSSATPLQIRCFHPTPAAKLFESSEAIVAACLGVAGGALLTRFLHQSTLMRPRRATPERLPPGSWWLAADEKTRQDVKAIINAGFEMASRAPKHRREQAYREASFQVPHEIARLNPDAPHFRVEEMAPLSFLRDVWQDMAKMGIHIDAPFDKERDVRIFLYFPSALGEATAAFMAINAEYLLRHRQLKRVPGGVMADHDQRRLLLAAQNIWMCQNVRWGRRHPEILRRIGTPQLPLIITFRGQAVGGGVWDSETSLFPDWTQFENVLDFMIEDA